MNFLQDDRYLRERISEKNKHTIHVWMFDLYISDTHATIYKKFRIRKSAVDFLIAAQEQIVYFFDDLKGIIKERKFFPLNISIALYVIALPFNKYGFNIFSRYTKYTEVFLLLIVFFGIVAIIRRRFDDI